MRMKAELGVMMALVVTMSYPERAATHFLIISVALIIERFLIDIVSHYVLLCLLPEDQPVSAHEAAIVFAPASVDHLYEAEIQKHPGIAPDTFPETAHSHLVYAQGSSYPGCRPTLPKAPQDKPLFISTQPGTSVLRTSRGWLTSKSLVKGWLRHYFANSPKTRQNRE